MTEKQRKGAILVFAVYLFLLTWLVLFKLSLPHEMAYLVSGRRVELVPFAPRETGTRASLTEMLANAAVFVPLGAYLAAFLEKRKPLRLFLSAVGIGCALSLCYEIAQYAFAIGAADVTDLIMNTAGTALGVPVFLLLRKIFGQRAAGVMNGAGIAAEILVFAFMAVVFAAN